METFVLHRAQKALHGFSKSGLRIQLLPAYGFRAGARPDVFVFDCAKFEAPDLGLRNVLAWRLGDTKTGPGPEVAPAKKRPEQEHLHRLQRLRPLEGAQELITQPCNCCEKLLQLHRYRTLTPSCQRLTWRMPRLQGRVTLRH